jgi:hypothetical protein
MDWMASAVELGTLRAWEVLGLGPPNREEARKRIAELELRAVGR